MAKTGRKTKYQPKYCQKLIDFFDIEPFEKVPMPHTDRTGAITWTDFKLVPNKLPTLRKFAKSIGVAYQTIHNWTKAHKEFFDAFTHAKEIRKEFLIDNALAGLYPPLTFKFVAVNLTDMVDKSETGLNVLNIADIAALMRNVHSN